MKIQALRWTVTGFVLISSHLFAPGILRAEPLADLQARLAGLQNDQATRIKVDVELRHKGTAPLHRSGQKRRGQATVVYGPEGVKMINQRWLGSSSRFSVWRKSKVETETPLLGFDEAADLINPAETLQLLLIDATLLSEETVLWQGRPTRHLVIRPGLLAADQPLTLEVGIWLDETGLPLAMERSMKLGFALLNATSHQAVTFQQVDGRLLVDEARETYSGTALAVLRGMDTKKVKVTSVR
jgi:hypothetical protein